MRLDGAIRLDGRQNVRVDVPTAVEGGDGGVETAGRSVEGPRLLPTRVTAVGVEGLADGVEEQRDELFCLSSKTLDLVVVGPTEEGHCFTEVEKKVKIRKFFCLKKDHGFFCLPTVRLQLLLIAGKIAAVPVVGHDLGNHRVDLVLVTGGALPLGAAVSRF